MKKAFPLVLFLLPILVSFGQTIQTDIRIDTILSPSNYCELYDGAPLVLVVSSTGPSSYTYSGTIEISSALFNYNPSFQHYFQSPSIDTISMDPIALNNEIFPGQHIEITISVPFFDLDTANNDYLLSFPNQHPSFLLENDVLGFCNGEIQVSFINNNLQPTLAWLPYNFGNTSTISDLCAGEYSCIITDSICIDTINILIDSVGPTITYHLISPGCGYDNGELTINTNVDTTHSIDYLWSDGSNTNHIENLSQGLYSLTLTIDSAYIFTEQYYLFDSVTISVDFTVSEPFGPNYDFLIEADVSGGTPPYTYSWNSGISVNETLIAQPGDHFLHITDSLGCSVLKSININVPNVVVKDSLLTSDIEELFAPGTLYSNISTTGHDMSRRKFTNGFHALGLDSGMILSTGFAFNAEGPNLTTTNGVFNYPGYDDYNSAMNVGASLDASVLEFDFLATSSTFSLKYVFASEGYPEFVGAGFNEGVAILLTGPNPLGGAAYNNLNLAVVNPYEFPLVPVSIQTINSYANSNAYLSNSFGSSGHSYDGFTEVRNAYAFVEPGSTYHVEIVVADVGMAFESAVFLEAGSINSCSVLTTSITTSTGTNQIREGCLNRLDVHRIDTLYSDSLIFYLEIDATSIADTSDLNGFTTSPYYILPEEDSTSIFFEASLDLLNEGQEFLILNVISESPYSTFLPTESTILYIQDNFPLDAGIVMNDSTLCTGYVAPIIIETYVNNNVPAQDLSYKWNTQAVSSSINILPALFESSLYTVTISDICGTSIVDSVLITIDQLSSLNIVSTPVSCLGEEDGTVTVTPNTPLDCEYQWSGPLTQLTGDSALSNLPEGFYQVTVTSESGCELSSSFDILSPSALVIDSMVMELYSIQTGAMTLIPYVSGGTPSYHYTWSNQVYSANNQNLLPGTYSLTVTDYNFCQVSNTYVINSNGSLGSVHDFVKNTLLYPNPVTENLYIRTDEHIQKLKPILYDESGRVISVDFIKTTHSYQINMQDYSPGIYYLKLYEDLQDVYKIVKL